MSEFIQSFREQNPQYNDMADDQLVTALHGKYYSDIPIEQFNQKIGFQVSPVDPVVSESVAEQDPGLIAQPRPQEPVAPMTGYGASSDIPIQQQEPIPQQQPVDGFTGAAMKAPEEQSMLELVSGKLKNWGAGAGERAGDVGGALLSTIQTVGEGIEQKLPMGGFVWEDGDIIPSYKSPEEWAKTDVEPILNKGAEVLEGIDLGYQEKVGWEDVKKSFSEGGPLSGSAYADVLEYGIEQGVKSVPDMVAAIYALPTYIFARSGEIGEQRAQNKGKEKAELEDVLEAAPFAVASSLLERIGAKGITKAGKEEIGKEILKAGIKESTKRVAAAGGKAMTKEAATEAIQEGMIEYVGERYGTDVAMDWKEALDRAAAGAVAGGVFGGAGGLATSTANEINYSPEKVIAKQLEKDIEATDVVGTEQAAIEALSPEQAQIQQEQKIQQKQELKANEPQAKSEPVKPVAKQEFEIDKAQTTEQEPVALELPEEKPVKQQIIGKEVVEAPIEEITISEDVPQFKEGANVKGVVEPLGGKFERTGVAPVQIWVREDGRKEVVSGRHRLDLAERSGEKTIPAQYHYESEGFGADQAAVLDAMLNIREGQGKVKDYVDFIKATKPRKQEAESQGILARQTGKRAFTIATEGSDALITSHRNDQLTDEAATRIAEAAPRNEKLQAVGIKAIQEGKTIAVAENMVKAVKTMTDETAQQSGDLFGFDDSAMVEAENLAKAAVKKQSEIQKTLSAVQGAAKRPELAAKEGVDVKNPEAIKARIAELKEQKRDWQNWHTNPKLTQELKAQPEKAVTDEKPAITEEAKAPASEPAAQPSPKEKDTFTNWNAKDSEGGPAEQSFARGEYAKAIKSDSKGTFFDGGEIEGISQAKQQAKIKGVWHDFGSIVKADKPEPIKKPTKPMPEVVEAVNKKKGKGLTDADEVSVPKADYATEPAQAYRSFMESVANQTATVAEIKADAESLVKNKDAIIAKMSDRKFTKAMLQQITHSPRSDLKKPQMVKSAYERMLAAHVMGDATFTIFGGSKTYEQQMMDKINKQTQADVDAAYEKQREYRAQMKQRKDEFVKSLSNPETLPEFKEFIRVRGKDKMSPEQLAAYDELVAESMAEVKPEVVKAEAEAVTTERAQTKHTKTGADLFVVKMVGRVPKEQFRELSGKAKQLGGYYSSYSKGDAIPGFQFKTVEAADKFEQLLSGKDVDKSDFAEAKAEVKQSKNAEKLLNMAEKMEAKATEEINRPRQSNTARRASMAANATERAEKQLALAKTVRNIAVKLQEGEVKHLGQMSQVTQLEELITIQKRAIPNDLYEQGSFDGYSISRPLKEGVTVDDYINLVDFPGIELDSGIIDRVADTLKGKRGYARLYAELRKLPKGKRDSLRKLTKEQGDKIMLANKAGLLESYSLSWLPDQVATLNRLGKLGISTGEQLRAAIRELDSLRVAKRQEDPVKKLERDLVGKKIEGFFPTPTPLVDQMIDYADIKPGHEVLEHSAGKGNIADQIMVSAPDASLDVVEYNTSLASLLEVKGYNVVGNDFLEYSGKQYDRIVMNPPFENFQDIDHVKHAYDLLKPGGKLVAIMGAGVKNSRKKAVEFREWLDDAGSYIEDLPEGSFKGSERSTGVNTVMVTIEKNDTNTLNYKKDDSKVSPTPKDGERVFHAPGHNFIGMFRSTGIPERRDFVTIEGRKLKIPENPQRIEPIMSKLIKITGRRIYFGKIKGKSAEGFYRPNVGEIRTRRKNDVEVLAHEMAHYLDVYSNITLPNFQKLYKDPKYSSEVAALSYTDADPKIEKIEGFAEFVRLWLTNANEAQLRAPKFYDAFTNELARDRKLLNPMRDMQDLMHKFYFQGPDKLGQALIGQDVSFKQRFNEWAYRRDSRIRQQVIDRFHAARKVEQELTRKIGTVEESAWKQFRIANGGAEGISDYILNYGTVQFDEKGDLKRSGKSLHEVMEPVKTIKLKPEHEGDQKIDLLMRYFAGRRALELHRQKRENLIPKETAKEWARLGKDYPVFESIQKEYQQFNDRMMDFYEEAGMVTPEGRKTMQSMNKDYVPFNRIRDQLAGGKGAASAGFQKLKGGTANLNDILVNIQDGITANVRSALNNRAKQRLYQYISGHKDGAIFATKIAPDSKPVQVYADEMQAKISKVLEANGIEIEGDLDLASKELLTFWQHGVAPRVNESGNIVDSVIINGKPKYYEVQDPMLQEMLMSMNPESYSSFMNVMFGVKNFFTRTITLGIEFTGANLVRDTVGATFLSKNNFKPFISSFQGMYSFLAKDKYYQDFIRSGGGHSSRLEGATRDGQARRRVKLDEFGVMTGPERLLSSIDNLASAFEYGTRIGEYRLAKKNMKSDMDAGFDAREISTDFSVLGANRFLTGYIRTVPFLNAMVQSQDRVFREAAVSKRYDGNPTGMAMKAFLGITVPTLILYLVNKDDEDYKAIPDYEKRTNWHIKIGDGQFVKIPRPYDVGFVYATMPELFAKYVEDDKGKEFADGMLWTMTQMYGIDGTPAMMTGWWDLVRNEKWTGAPVVPQSLSDVEAPEQYTSNTSETFVRMGEALGVSPIKAEHMFKAYTGYLGGYLMAGTDHLLWDESKFGEKPNRKLSENAFLRRFLTPDVRPATANMEKFFNLKEQSDKIVSTFKQTVDVRRQIKGQGGTGKFKDDNFYGLSGKEKEVLFGLNDSMNQLIKLMYGKEGIKTAELKIKYDKNLSGKEKREQMDKLWLARNKAFETYYNQANQALQKAKREAKQEK
ncbi:LPD38 domain-containing protein [Pseudoalteromonas sp.]|uniref:LPD38 domain-containing protein n=3 Tax=Bacteria TaxID=2 RepID=UPI002619169A|nr:LPD38 domain-containing protein [Pseudoalteromonas sp.]